MKKVTPKKPKKVSKKVTTHIAFVLDKSGSMMTITDATISGFNEYIQTLQHDKKGDYLFSLTMFDTEFVKSYVDKLIRDVSFLNPQTYQPGGNTALYDAVMKTINELKGEKDPVLMVIMTDGEENSSKEYNRAHLTKAIKELEAKGNWTFVYLGANQDSWANASVLGFSQGNVSNFSFSAKGMENAMNAVAQNTMGYSASLNSNQAKNRGIKNMSNFMNGTTNIDEK